MEKNEITEYIDHFFKKAQEKGSIKAFSFVYGALNKKFGPGTKDKYQKYMDELKEQIVKKPQIKKIEEKPKNISGESDIFGDSQEEKKIEEQQQEEELKLDTSDYVNEANTKKEELDQLKNKIIGEIDRIGCDHSFSHSLEDLFIVIDNLHKTFIGFLEKPGSSLRVEYEILVKDMKVPITETYHRLKQQFSDLNYIRYARQYFLILNTYLVKLEWIFAVVNEN